MSRTKRNYPTWEVKSRSVFYKDTDDVPRPETCLYIEEEVKEYYWEWGTEWIEREAPWWSKHAYHYYSRPVLVKKHRWVKTGRMVPDITWWRQPQNYAYVDRYDEKSLEGWNHCNRQHCSQSVGHYNKKIRSRKHRSEAKQVIRSKWMKGDYDTDIPVEKNHDRWDWW